LRERNDEIAKLHRFFMDPIYTKVKHNAQSDNTSIYGYTMYITLNKMIFLLNVG
jgi:hypothetical protein